MQPTELGKAAFPKHAGHVLEHDIFREQKEKL